MARIRSVKPELRTSEVVASWPREVRYFFVLFWGYLDDCGRGLDVPKTIAGDCFPHDDDVTPQKIDKWLKMMANTKLLKDKEPPICRYEANGRRYVHCLNWGEHQRPNRPTPSRLPPCPLHEGLTESHSELDSEPLHGTSVSGAAVFDSRGIRQQQETGTEPLGERLTAAAEIIFANTDATQAEALTLARWVDRERKPRNLAGMVRTLSQSPDLTAMLTDQRKHANTTTTAATIATARRGPPCVHGEPGGANPHPTTGQPLCPQCRQNPAWNASTATIKAVAQTPPDDADTSATGP